MARVAIAMSGGVDSSVAAGLLRRQGHDVVGITLQLWDYTRENLASGTGRCCSPADIRDARAVAAHLDIPHYVFDHGDHFRREVIEPFLDGWAQGRTPSPCISCNRRIKFDALWRMARALGAERLATGHYARLEHVADVPRIRKSVDEDKDQSYFLFDVASDRLRDVMFPLGSLHKDEVRSLARELELGVADKPESYELCFIPDGDKDAFVRRERGESASPSGRFRDHDGNRLGDHDGTHRFTIGQRRGLGVDLPERLYVISIDGDSGDVTLGPEAALHSDRLEATDCNWLAVAPPSRPLRARARIRHRHAEAWATLCPHDHRRVEVRFDEPQRAIAPGQGVAFYDDDLLLGGGWIRS